MPAPNLWVEGFLVRKPGTRPAEPGSAWKPRAGMGLGRREGEGSPAAMKENRDAGRKPRRCSPGERSQDLPVSSRRIALESMRKGRAPRARRRRSCSPGSPGRARPGSAGAWFTSLQGRWSLVSVEMSGALDPLDFLRLIAEGLGMEAGDRIGARKGGAGPCASRTTWATGDRGCLCWRTPSTSCNRSGTRSTRWPTPWKHREGFGAMILTGPSELARRLAGRPLSSGGVADLVPCPSPAAGPRRGLRAGRIARGSRARGPGRPG